MHKRQAVEAALALAGRGVPAARIARELSIPRSTIRAWLAGRAPRNPHDPSQPCSAHELESLPPAYVYLLGLYLGDGWLSTPSDRTPKLRIALDAKYPQIVLEARWAIERIRGNKGGALTRPRNCIEVYSYWKHWPCLLPQHGKGKKHERPIALKPWQVELTRRWPWELLRGLIHSDGCRFLNTGRNWSSPRYAFKQRSADIRAIFCSACDQIGVRWTEAPDTIYVSRKADVAVLDGFVGPKW